MIGSIYKIIHLDSSITYIGSTCNTTRDRWSKHKSSYKNWLSNKEKYGTIAIYTWFEQYGVDRFKMILVKSYEVCDKDHLRVYEQLAMNRTKCVNDRAAISLISQNCMAKHYYEQNKQKISKQQKQYRDTNKQLISERKKQHYGQNKRSISSQVTCECGVTINKSSLSAHRKTQKHLTALAAQSN